MSRSRKSEYYSRLALSGVNGDIDVATGAQRMSLAGHFIFY